MSLEVSQRLADMRREKGYSQEALASELGLSRQAVSKWERGESQPDTGNLIALADLYGVTLDELVREKAPEKAAEPEAALEEAAEDGMGDAADEGVDASGSCTADASAREDAPLNTASGVASDVSPQVPLPENADQGTASMSQESGKQALDAQVPGMQSAVRQEPASTASSAAQGQDQPHTAGAEAASQAASHQGQPAAAPGPASFQGQSGPAPSEAPFQGCPSGAAGPDAFQAQAAGPLPSSGCPGAPGSQPQPQAAQPQAPQPQPAKPPRSPWVTFPYPLLVVVLFLLAGFFFHAWNPAWVLFLTIPFYYWIVKVITDDPEYRADRDQRFGR